MNGYGSEIDASPPFFWEAIGHKHGLMLHRKIMWRDRYSATGCSPALQAVDSKQAENLSVGKTKSYWTNNRERSSATPNVPFIPPVRAWERWHVTPGAYSARRLPLIPVETCHRFQAKVA